VEIDFMGITKEPISFDEMKEVLMQRGVNPKLGTRTISETLDEIDVLKVI
jgi:hypothetical protein